MKTIRSSMIVPVLMLLICTGVVTRTQPGDVRPVYELALFAAGVSAGVLLSALIRWRWPDGRV